MLISHEHKFIVGLPTKCGTNSMRNMANKFAQGSKANHNELHEIPKLRHRLDVPEGCEDYRRAMVIRNPFSRIPSMYEYLRRNTWEWKYKFIMEQEEKFGRRKAWTNFLHMLIDEQVDAALKPFEARKVHGKRPFIWTDRLTDMAAFLGGRGEQQGWPSGEVTFLKLENLANDWDDFARSCGWMGAPEPKKSNATRGEDKLHPNWRGYFATDMNRRLGFMFVGEDVKLPYVNRLSGS